MTAAGLSEPMRVALIAMHRRGTPVSFGNNGLYGPVMAPSTAYALERRQLATVRPASPGLLGAYQGQITFTDAGRELAATLDAEARQRERDRIAALELSPPRRGHLRVVRDA